MSSTQEQEQKRADKRVSVDFSGPAYETLSKLAKARNRPKTAIIREALEFEKWLQDTQESGGRILVERDGEVREIVRL